MAAGVVGCASGWSRGKETLLRAVRLLADVLGALGVHVAALRHSDVRMVARRELHLGVQAHGLGADSGGNLRPFRRLCDAQLTGC